MAWMVFAQLDRAERRGFCEDLRAMPEWRLALFFLIEDFPSGCLDRLKEHIRSTYCTETALAVPGVLESALPASPRDRHDAQRPIRTTVGWFPVWRRSARPRVIRRRRRCGP
jgi:hypothetical protein